MHNGKALQWYVAEVQATIAEAKNNNTLKSTAETLGYYLNKAQQTTLHLMSMAAKDTERFLADATLYLELFGIVSIGWQWLKMGIVAEQALPKANGTDAAFYHGKLAAMQYFFEYELVKIEALAKRLQSAHYPTVETQEDWF
jgi:hypothetical protein